MERDQDLQSCIEECTLCHAICTETIKHCLEKSGRHSEAKHIRLLEDCAEICQTSANFMLRGSDLHLQTCSLSADVCDRCARSCEQIDAQDSIMKQCAGVCRSCGESCREMLERGRKAA